VTTEIMEKDGVSESVGYGQLEMEAERDAQQLLQ
jgi:hypothetical protein